MHSKQIGLVVEGGGMRGAYTAGVLDAFHDKQLSFPYVIGVSAGANNATSFLAEQRGRNDRIFTEWITDSRFVGIKNLLRDGNYFGMDFIFNEIPNRLEPFDYDTFMQSSATFKVCVANCKSGQPVYLEPLKSSKKDIINTYLKASSSLPLISKPVDIGGEFFLDGGIVDPIPIKKAFEDGNQKNVIILTRNKDYRKKASSIGNMLSRVFLSDYPNLIEQIKYRHEKYNETLDMIENLEKEGKVFVIRPSTPLKVDRFEKDSAKLKALYEQGYNEAYEKIDELNNWLC